MIKVTVTKTDIIKNALQHYMLNKKKSEKNSVVG